MRDRLIGLKRAALQLRRLGKLEKIGLGLGVTALLAAAVALWTTPSTLVTASLRTERLQLQVTSAEAARLAFRRARADQGLGCVEDLFVEPGVGATVTYTRPARAALEIYIEGPMTVLFGQDQEPKPQPKRLTVEVAGAGDCAADPGSSQRLPVEGSQVSFGAHPLQLAGARDVPLRLLGGQLTVYGRALSEVFGLPVTFIGRRNAIYVAGTIPVPGGSVIEDRGDDPGSADRVRSAIWSGFADVDFHEGGGMAMSVEAATNAGSVFIFLPTPNTGGSARSDDPETVSLSLMARLTGDPHLLLAYGAIGLLIAAGGLLRWVLAKLWPRPERAA